MTTTNDGAATDDTSPEGDGSPETGTPVQKGTDAKDPVELARRRQAGAEAARQEAARQLAEAQAKLAEYEAKDRSAADQKANDIATLQERLKAAEEKAAQAEAKAEAKVLDIKYPNARKQLPEITDEVRLAFFEAMFTEDGTPEPPTPQNPNESNRAASGDASGSQPKEETSADILAKLKAGGRPDWL